MCIRDSYQGVESGSARLFTFDGRTLTSVTELPESARVKSCLLYTSHYGVEKRSLPEKLFGVFDHRVLKPSSPLFRGFDDVFPVSYTHLIALPGCPIRKSADQCVCATPRSLSQLVTSFVGS